MNTSNALHNGLHLQLVHSDQLGNSNFYLYLSGEEDYISDHSVDNKKTLPGAAYIEAICEATEILGYGKVKKILSTIWIQPLICNQKHIKLNFKTSMSENRDLLHFECYSYPNEEEKIIHIQSKVLVSQTSDFSKGNTFNLRSIQDRCTSLISREECYAVFNRIELNYGPNFKTISFVKFNPDEAIALLELPYNLRKNADDFYLHPSLLDGAFQSAIGIVGADIDTTFVPYTFKSIEIYDSLKDVCYVYITSAEKNYRKDSQIRRFDLFILDEQGNSIIKIEDFCIKVFKTENNSLIHEPPSSPFILYAPIKEEKEPIKCDGLSGAILIFHSNHSLSESIEKKITTIAPDVEMIHVRFGKTYKKTTNNNFEINVDNIKDYLTLLDTLKKEGIIPRKIITTPSYENLDNQGSTKILDHLMLLTQSIINLNIQSNLCIYSIGIHSKGINKVFHLALEGFNRTLILERKNIRSVCIEVESPKEDNSNSDDMINYIMDELSYSSDNENLIIIKEGRRIGYHNKELRLNNEEKKEIPLRHKGTYIITGGMGEIGFIFAQYLARKIQANIVLTGRSALSAKIVDRISVLESLGARVIYIKGDVSKKKDVERIIAQTRAIFKNIQGIIHSAGVIRDAYIIKKTPEEIEEVLAPKVKGTLYLDEATKDENIELFILFSSVTSIIGNMGQSDYAYANSFMDHFAEFREDLKKKGERSGKTVSINWPLWAEGGMKINAYFLQMIENRTGVKPLSTELALKAFEQILLSGENRIGVVTGNEKQIIKAFELTASDHTFIRLPEVKEENNKRNSVEQSKQSIKEKACKELLDIFSALFKIEKKELDIDADLMEFGFSSIIIMNFLNILEETYHEPIEPNEILHIRTISEYADFLIERGLIQHEIKVTKEDHHSTDTNTKDWPPVENKHADIHNRKVAIIGMSCKLPKANSIEAYWRNLTDGVNAISEIPKDRLDVHAIYSQDKSEPYKSYSKWGGFIDDLYSFDADFFNIPYRDAAVMDPKQRIILELAQEVIENAGYNKEELSNSRTSVYLGAGESSYATDKMSLIPETEMKSAVVDLIQNMISARISDYYNLKGDSLNIDSACSSSLVAIHYAVKSILSGEADYSIAGGIDIITDPFPFIAFSKAGVLSEDGASYVFDKKANGFVIGEGGGLILLKDYDTAIKDGDQILGIISGSAVNNDGNTVGITVPNQHAQQEVICKALETAGVSAESISYLEAHGTGTLLGDPIEVKAASLAYEKYTNEKEFCAIGSVKSNIGHLQRASGVAGTIKVVMALHHKIIPPTLHCSEPHPRFKFSETPFYPITKAKKWFPRQGVRRAGISSFGFGGTNCHLILEEFIAPASYVQKRYSHPKTKFNKQDLRLHNLKNTNKISNNAFDYKADNNPLSGEQINKKQANNTNELTSQIEEYLKSKVIRLIDGYTLDEVDIHKNFMDMGIDSIQLIRLTEEISQELNIELYPTLFFEYQNGKEMAQYLADTWGNSIRSIDAFMNHTKKEEQHIQEANTESIKGLHTANESNNKESIADANDRDIAIIGMSGLFAGSSDLDAFWKNLVEQEELMSEIPQERFDYRLWYDPEFQKQDKIYCKWGSFIQDADKFDADFFNISRREAEAMDPQLRKLLQVLYHTTEDAGYASKIKGTNTGMYTGACYRDFFQEMGSLNKNVEIYDGTGNALTMLANRPSFYYDLKGPSIAVDTACSSSLVSMHLAIKALRDNECDMAFVAGVNLILSPWRYKYFCSIGALSTTGRCHAFDEKADGYVPGEAIAAILLKPLRQAIKDGDSIHAIVKGTAVNSGGYTASITAPSVNLEKEVIDKAWKDARINPETIGYIEAHGTGTRLGDPIEIEAIKKAFAPYTQKESFCSVGSVKANIGHTEGAAGIAGVIKTVLAMKNKKIPAMPKFNELNSYIKLDGSPLFIHKENTEWKPNNDTPRRAGVSAFGFGGTYAHAVLEEYVAPTEELALHKNDKQLPFYSFTEEQFSFLPHGANGKDNPSVFNKHTFYEVLSEDNPFANEHIIGSKRILPGAVCIEMMRAAAESAGNRRVRKISNVTFLQPIEVEKEDKKIQIEIGTKNKDLECEICNVKNATSRFTYARGDIKLETNPENIHLKQLDIESRRHTFTSFLSGENIYEQFYKMGFKIGKTHRTLKELYFKENKGIAKLTLSGVSDITDYYLNPLLLDGVFHAVLALTQSNTPTYLFQIGEITIDGPLPANCWAYIEIKEIANSILLTASVEICDESGNVLVTIDRIEGQNISPEYRTYTPDNKELEIESTGFLIHENDLIHNQEMTHVVSTLFRKYAREEASVARKDIAPWLFISSDKDCFAYINKNKNILVMFNFIGPEDRYEGFLSEIMKFSESISLEFEFITNRKIYSINKKPLSVTNFAATQRIFNLDQFTLNGKERKKLRYLVSKFQKDGNCRVDEYFPSSNPSIDIEILSIIDAWCSSKKMINSYIKRIKDQIKRGNPDDGLRFFLTYKDEKLVNVIIIIKMPAGGYLMDMEFYKSDMPLGGLEYNISEIISKLVSEGEKVFSLGVTWGVCKEQLNESDKETVSILTELQMQNIFTGDGNFQFKNKFCPQNFMLYLIHPIGNNPGNIEDIILMIASPESPVPQSTDQNEQEEERLKILKEYGFNPMRIPCEKVEIDFVTDSWAELESEAISRRLAYLNAHNNIEVQTEDRLRHVFPFSNILLTSSGRMAESLLYASLNINKTIVPQNLLFPTGLFHQIDNNKIPLEIPDYTVYQTDSNEIFKGNIDCTKLKDALNENKGEIAYICIELSSNASGGCPISLQNIKEVRDISSQQHIPIVMDATRILENAIFISKYEKGYETKNCWDIVNELLQMSDYVVASLTKDFSTNAGGIIATNNHHIFHEIKSSFAPHTYELNTIDRKRIGVSFADKDYLLSQVEERMNRTQLLWSLLKERNIPVASPCGGHCVLLDTKLIQKNEDLQYPLHSFLNWFYHKTGIRASAHNPGLKKDTSLSAMIRLAVPIGTDKGQIEIAANRIGSLFTKSPIHLKDLIMDSKPSGLFGLAKASFKQMD